MLLYLRLIPGNQGTMGGAFHEVRGMFFFWFLFQKNGVCEKPIVIRFEGFSIKWNLFTSFVNSEVCWIRNFQQRLSCKKYRVPMFEKTANDKNPKFTYKWISGFQLTLWKRKNIARNCAMFCFISNDLEFGLLRWVLL